MLASATEVVPRRASAFQLMLTRGATVGSGSVSRVSRLSTVASAGASMKALAATASRINHFVSSSDIQLKVNRSWGTIWIIHHSLALHGIVASQLPFLGSMHL